MSYCMVKLNDAILDNTLVDRYQIRFLVQDLKKVVTNVGLVLHRFASFFTAI